MKLINKILHKLNISVGYGRSIKSPDTLLEIKSLIKKTIRLKGSLIELGVYRGGTTVVIADTLKELKSSKILYSLDSFEGQPYPETDTPNIFTKHTEKQGRRFADTNYEGVLKVLYKKGLNNVMLLEGDFIDLFKRLENKKFCYAFVDCDSRTSYEQSIKFLLPRMAKNGIIQFCNYQPEIYKACNEVVEKYFFGKDLIKTKFDGYYWKKWMILVFGYFMQNIGFIFSYHLCQGLY